MRLAAAIAEAGRTAAVQRVTSLLTLVLCAAICAITVLTVGRTAAAETQVMSTIDDAGSRVLVISDRKDAGLITPAVVETLNGLNTIHQAIGIDSPFDVVNGPLGSGSEKVPAWRVLGSIDGAVELVSGRLPRPGEAIVADAPQATLGLDWPLGVVSDQDGAEYPVVGGFVARPPFQQFDKGILIVADAGQTADSVSIVISSVHTARATERAAVAILGPRSLDEIAVESPTALADLQRAVGGDLGSYGRGTLFLTLGAGAVLIAVVLLAEVLLRRRDLGRRRALGATRSGLLALVVTRTVLAATPGIVIGTGAGMVAAQLWAQRPSYEFAAGVGVLTLMTAAAAAVAPALLAAYRDPVGVLRTP